LSITPTIFIRGENIPKYLSEYKKTQWYSKKQIENIQLLKLKSLLNYSSKFVPYYQEVLRNNMILKNEFNYADLKKIPSLCKHELVKNQDKLISQNLFLFLSKKTTGGSTGQAVTIYKNPKAMAKERAATWRGYSWAGIEIGDKQGRFWGVPFSNVDRLKYKLIDIVTNRKRFSAFNFNEQSIEQYYRRLIKFKPTYLYGYVSMLTKFAEYLENQHYSIPFKLKCIITTSEVLNHYNRTLLEKVFNCRVFNEYGCGEVGSVAHECERGSMHIMAENMIVEILNGDNYCKEDEVGEIVITELNNYAMPLIRYRMGDYARLGTEPCECGRTLPILKDIIGREYDFIKNSEGKLFHGEYFMYIFEEIKKKDLGVKQFQVIQKSESSLLIKIIPSNNYSERTAVLIRKRIIESMGESIKVKFEMVDKIPREKSGKMRLIKALKR